MMSKAVIFATITKLTGWQGLSTLLLLGIVVPLWASSQCKEPTVAEIIKVAVLTGPFMPVVVAYFLIKDSIGNTRSLTDGEYLSLLFTRPLTRTTYVLTKWITCSILVGLLVFLQLAVFQISETIYGRADATVLNSFRLWDVALNSCSITALMVLINAFPPKVGIFIFAGLLYGTVLGGMLPQMNATGPHADSMAIYNTISSICGFVKTCLTPIISTNEIFNTTRFTWLPALAYVSNISLYLCGATYLLNKREFFYASN